MKKFRHGQEVVVLLDEFDEPVPARYVRLSGLYRPKYVVHVFRLNADRIVEEWRIRETQPAEPAAPKLNAFGDRIEVCIGGDDWRSARFVNMDKDGAIAALVDASGGRPEALLFFGVFQVRAAPAPEEVALDWDAIKASAGGLDPNPLEPQGLEELLEERKAMPVVAFSREQWVEIIRDGIRAAGEGLNRVASEFAASAPYTVGADMGEASGDRTAVVDVGGGSSDPEPPFFVGEEVELSDGGRVWRKGRFIGFNDNSDFKFAGLCDDGDRDFFAFCRRPLGRRVVMMQAYQVIGVKEISAQEVGMVREGRLLAFVGEPFPLQVPA
jgi:hypothetical protein